MGIEKSNELKLKNKISNTIRFLVFAGSIIFCSVDVYAGDVTVNDDIAVLYEEDTITLDVLNNDYGLSTGVASLSIVTEPENGVVQVLDDYTIQYIPNQSFYGEDEFVYQVCNVDGYCGQGMVDIVVYDVDFNPELQNDYVTYIQGADTVFDILSNDVLHDYPVTVEIEQDFTNGSSYLDADNNVNPTFDSTFSGEDSLKYIVYDNDGDSSEAWLFVDVQFEVTSFSIPNSFTPNGDGYNDYFYVPDFVDYSGIEFKVFNEWGQLVYKIEDYQNDWDGQGNTGSFAGKQVKEGTYYYIFKLSGGRVFTGYIFIMR